MNLKLENCRCQCHDGASNLRGRISGVATQILNDEPRAIYTHCYGHALNLACQDTVRSVKVIKDALDDIAPAEPGFRTLCPTRWTVKADSLHSVIVNYSVLQASLDTFTEMAAQGKCLLGIASQLDKFDFLFGVFLGEKVLRLAGNSAALLTCDALSAFRNNIEFEHSVLLKASEVGIEEPVLPWRRKAPSRFEIYRPQYFEARQLRSGLTSQVTKYGNDFSAQDTASNPFNQVCSNTRFFISS